MEPNMRDVLSFGISVLDRQEGSFEITRVLPAYLPTYLHTYIHTSMRSACVHGNEMRL